MPKHSILKTVTPLPESVTVDGCRILYTRAALLEYGLARAEAAYAEGYQTAQVEKAAPKNDGVSELFRAFGMKP